MGEFLSLMVELVETGEENNSSKLEAQGMRSIPPPGKNRGGGTSPCLA